MNDVIVEDTRMEVVSCRIIVVTVTAVHYKMSTAVLLKDLVVVVVVNSLITLRCVKEKLNVMQSHGAHILCIDINRA